MASSDTNNGPQTPSHIYHILLTSTHIEKNPNNVIEKVWIPGTYVSLSAAKAAAHSCLYDAGYERDWFDIYETKPEVLEASNLPESSGLAVYAVSSDGTTFRVRIDTTPNDKLGLSSVDTLANGRVTVPLYYVVQADVDYDSDYGGTVRAVNIEGVFTSYDRARELARRVLLSDEDEVPTDKFAEYSETDPKETDCGFGENVIVHAITGHGVNHVVSVIKNQELEKVRLDEAAMRIL